MQAQAVEALYRHRQDFLKVEHTRRLLLLNGKPEMGELELIWSDWAVIR